MVTEPILVKQATGQIIIKELNIFLISELLAVFVSFLLQSLSFFGSLAIVAIGLCNFTVRLRPSAAVGYHQLRIS